MDNKQLEILPNTEYAIRKSATNSLFVAVSLFVVMLFISIYAIINSSIPIYDFLRLLISSEVKWWFIFLPVCFFILQFSIFYFLIKKSRVKIILNEDGLMVFFGKRNEFMSWNDFNGLEIGAYNPGGRMLNKFKNKDKLFIPNLFKKSEVEEKIKFFTSNNK